MEPGTLCPAYMSTASCASRCASSCSPRADRASAWAERALAWKMHRRRRWCVRSSPAPPHRTGPDGRRDREIRCRGRPVPLVARGDGAYSLAERSLGRLLIARHLFDVGAELKTADRHIGEPNLSASASDSRRRVHARGRSPVIAWKHASCTRTTCPISPSRPARTRHVSSDGHPFRRRRRPSSSVATSRSSRPSRASDRRCGARAPQHGSRPPAPRRSGTASIPPARAPSTRSSASSSPIVSSSARAVATSALRSSVVKPSGSIIVCTRPRSILAIHSISRWPLAAATSGLVERSETPRAGRGRVGSRTPDVVQGPRPVRMALRRRSATCWNRVAAARSSLRSIARRALPA